MRHSFVRPIAIINFAFVVLGLVHFPISGLSEEVDDFDRGYSNFPSSSAGLNKMINEALKKFVVRYNDQKPNLGCDNKVLMKSILDYFNTNMSLIGNNLRDLQSPGVKNEFNISLFGPTSNEGSIFEGSNVWCCAKALKLNKSVVGLDKVDHFFGNGGLLAERWLEMSSKNEDAILEMNVNQEQGSWGLSGSNLKSYGDLASNWAGFKWYRDLFEGPAAYFSCEKGRLTQKRNFDIDKYVDDSWSESINCSAYPSAEEAGKVANNLKRLGLKCPSSPDRCAAIVEKFKDTPKVLYSTVSPVCRLGISVEQAVEKVGGSNWTEVKDIFKGARLRDFQDPANYVRGWNILVNKVNEAIAPKKDPKPKGVSQ